MSFNPSAWASSPSASDHNDYSTSSSSQSGGTDSRAVIGWSVGSIAVISLVLILLQCWKRHRITKRAKLAQDAVLNMPVAMPWDVPAVPYAEVVDIAANAPDHDELLPATEPEYHLQRL